MPTGQKAEEFSKKAQVAPDEIIRSSVGTYELVEDETQMVITALLCRTPESIKLVVVSIEERSSRTEKRNHFGVSRSTNQSSLLSSPNVTSPTQMLVTAIGNSRRSPFPDTLSGELDSENARGTKDEDHDYLRHSLQNLEEIIESLWETLRSSRGFFYTSVQGERKMNGSVVEWIKSILS